MMGVMSVQRVGVKAKPWQSRDMWGENMLLNTTRGGSSYLAANHMLVLFAGACF